MKSMIPKLILPILVSLLTACGPAQSPAETSGDDPASQDLFAIPTVSDLATGDNRLAFALLGPDQTEIQNAKVEAHFFYLGREEAEARGRADAPYQRISIQVPHEHPDGSVHEHEDVRGVYVVPTANLDTAGPWGAVLRVGLPGQTHLAETRLTFDVQEHSATPAIGEHAPASESPVAHGAVELQQVCSRVPPDSMHSLSIAEALQQNKPFVVTFASPSFCQSRLCGPVTDLVYSLAPDFQESVAFIHVEPFDLEKIRAGGGLELTPTAKAWGLPTEPWVFVVDANGMIAAKFEGMFSAEELQAAIEAATS